VGSAGDARDAYRRFGPALVRKAERILRSRDDAVDLVQGLFVDLIQRRGTLELPYLYRAVTNRCLNFVRDEANRARLLERDAQSLEPAPRVRCDDHAIGTQLLVQLAGRLDERHLEVLVCRYFDDMTQEEIGAELALSRKTVGKRLDRIREEVLALVGGAR
jgi:RNA polymerase sigma-70 factor (ECF subfamily)